MSVGDDRVQRHEGSMCQVCLRDVIAMDRDRDRVVTFDVDCADVVR